MWKVNTFLMLLVIILTGCMNDAAEDNNPQDIGTEQINNTEMNNEQKKYYQSDEKGIGKDADKRELFASDKELEITQLLRKRTDTKNAKVAIASDRVIISVILDDPEMTTEDFSREVGPEIEALIPDKEIFIYTDEYEWNQMKDLEASYKQKELGENIEYYIEKFFPIEIKD